MQSYLIVGPGITLDSEQTKNSFLEYGNELTIYGDGKNYIDCKFFDMPNNSHVIINVHGIVDAEANHVTALCSSQQFSYTYSAFREVNINNKALDIELFSCFGGAAINDVPPLSTLITLNSHHYSAPSLLNQVVLNKSSSFSHYDNPFIRFASYLFANPETTQFSIDTEIDIKGFVSSIQSLENYSILGIKRWQEQKLADFFEFCDGIKVDVSEYQQKQIDKMFRLLKDTDYRGEWLNQFDINYYRELLLINMINSGNHEAVKALTEADVSVNNKISDFFPLYLAAQEGFAEIAKILLNSGALINQEINSYLALDIAVLKDHIGVVKVLTASGAVISDKSICIASNNGKIKILEELLEHQAPVNAETKGYSALSLAIMSGHIEVTKALVKAGAEVNKKSNGFLPLDMAIEESNIEIIKILLSAGASTERNFFQNHETREIAQEYSLFSSDPIKYIFEHNIEAKITFNALKNLEFQTHLAELLPEILKVEDCLLAQPEGIITNLNGICGENGSYYANSEL